MSFYLPNFLVILDAKMDSDDDQTLPDLILTPAPTPVLPKKRNHCSKKKKQQNDSSDDEIEFDFSAHERRTTSSHEDSDAAPSSPRGI